MISLHILNILFSKQSPKSHIYVKIEYPLHIEEEQYFICRYTMCSVEIEKYTQRQWKVTTFEISIFWKL